jgi:hypothetical protein
VKAKKSRQEHTPTPSKKSNGQTNYPCWFLVHPEAGIPGDSTSLFTVEKITVPRRWLLLNESNENERMTARAAV